MAIDFLTKCCQDACDVIGDLGDLGDPRRFLGGKKMAVFFPPGHNIMPFKCIQWYPLVI